MTVRIRVRRLVVDGSPVFDREAFAAELIRELRRLAERSALAGRSAPVANAGNDVSADPERDPVGAARAVAAVVHSRLLEATDD